MNLYVTADAVGTPTGGGKVTYHESRALMSLGETDVWQFPAAPRPWGADEEASTRLDAVPDYKPTHAHFYSGTFTKTIERLKARGTTVTYTAAAHDIQVSRREHEQLGIPFEYPHLTDPVLWRQYVRGYLLADAVICPSRYSAQIMNDYGCQNVYVIPHGFDPPTRLTEAPRRFTVAYLGQPGADKGLRYLFAAWNTWARRHPDALLIVAGRGTLGLVSWAQQLCQYGSYYIRGEVEEPRDLYDACSLYIQPSASEGFGCEVVEARSHGRPVVASAGAGAAEYANQVVAPCDSSAIAAAIDHWYVRWRVDPRALSALADSPAIAHLRWDRIRERYTEFFTSTPIFLR